MKRLLLSMLLALLCCNSPAQTAIISKECAVGGQVIDASTGKPITGARVTLQSAENPSQSILESKTTAGGRFLFSRIGQGTYSLRAEYRGFIPDRSVEDRSAAFLLLPGQKLEPIVLKLLPQAVIAGTVFRENGDPLSGALISALEANSSHRQVAHAYTNDLGEFRLYGLPPRHYYVTATYRGIKESTYYQRARNIEDAALLEVAPGKVLTGIDLVLSLSGEPRAISVSAENGQPGSVNASIEGRVINATTGNPVPGAYLWLDGDDTNRQSRLSFSADGSGYFSLMGIKPGEYRLNAIHRGFIAGKLIVRGAGQLGDELTLTSGATLKEITVELTPTGVIAGRVLAENGDPLANALVMAVGSTLLQGRREFSIVKRVYTDDLGMYRLYDLPPGHYYVSAICLSLDVDSGIARWSAREEAEETGYPPSYYPNATSLAEAAPLNVRSGAVLSGIDLALATVTKVGVRGRVRIYGSTQPAIAAVISLTPIDLLMVSKFSRRSVGTKANSGEFELQAVPPGNYILAAEWLSEGKRFAAAQEITVGKTEVSGIVLTLLPPQSVSGHIRVEGQQDFDLSTLRVSLQPQPMARVAAETGVNQNGAFDFENLPPDCYRIRVSSLDSNLYLKAVYFQAKNISQSGMDLSRSTSQGGLEIIMSPNGGSIGGVVLHDDHEIAAAAKVVLVPEDGRNDPELYKSTTTDATGKFNLNAIAPGQYRLAAFNDLDDSEEVVIFERMGEHVRIEENSTQNIRLNLIHPRPF